MFFELRLKRDVVLDQTRFDDLRKECQRDEEGEPIFTCAVIGELVAWKMGWAFVRKEEALAKWFHDKCGVSFDEAQAMTTQTEAAVGARRRACLDCEFIHGLLEELRSDLVGFDLDKHPGCLPPRKSKWSFEYPVPQQKAVVAP